MEKTLSLLLVLTACGLHQATETTGPNSQKGERAACQDGLDNDGDGHADCDDQDCADFVFCDGVESEAEAEAESESESEAESESESEDVPDAGRPDEGAPDAGADAGSDGGAGTLDPMNDRCDVIYDESGAVFESECGGDAEPDCVLADGGDGYCDALCVVGGDCCPGAGGACAVCGFCEVCVPTTEVCDGTDDDCDGTVDEGLTELRYRDEDGDGYGNAEFSALVCTDAPPIEGVTNADDCNDADAGMHPGLAEFCDGTDDDCDSATEDGAHFNGRRCFGLIGPDFGCHEDVATGEVICIGECQPGIYVCTSEAASLVTWECVGMVDPTAEDCGAGTGNGLDEDCDGTTDEGCPDCLADSDCGTNPACFTARCASGTCVEEATDADGDGFTACGTCGGLMACGQDCNDGDPEIYPGAAERCNGEDDNCGGAVDEGTSTETPCDGPDTDACADDQIVCAGTIGYVCSRGTDSIEDCGSEGYGDGVDENCNGEVDETCPECVIDVHCGTPTPCRSVRCESGGCVTELVDADSDGFTACSGDCNDGDPEIYPGAAERCNGEDDSCGGAVDEGTSTETPCDGPDTDACADDQIVCAGTIGYVCSTGGNTVEDCGPSGLGDGVNEDCDGTTDEGCPDCLADSDCGTTNPACFTALCMSGACVEEATDADGDGVEVCTGDCNDDDADIYLGNTEICDGKDQDCDGQMDEGLRGTTVFGLAAVEGNGGFESSLDVNWQYGGAFGPPSFTASRICSTSSEGNCALLIENPTPSLLEYDEQFYRRGRLVANTRYVLVVNLHSPNGTAGYMGVQVLDWDTARAVWDAPGVDFNVDFNPNFGTTWMRNVRAFENVTDSTEIYLALNVGLVDSIHVDGLEFYACLPEGGGSVP